MSGRLDALPYIVVGLQLDVRRVVTLLMFVLIGKRFFAPPGKRAARRVIFHTTRTL